MRWSPIVSCLLGVVLPASSAHAQISQLFDSSIPSKLVGEVIANDGQGNLEVKYEATSDVGSIERTVRIDMTEAGFFQYPVTVYSTDTACRTDSGPYLVRVEDVKNLMPDPNDDVTGWFSRWFDPNLGEFIAPHVVSWRRHGSSAPFQLALMAAQRNTTITVIAVAIVTAQGTCEVLSTPIAFANNVDVIKLRFTTALQEDGELEPQFIAPYRVDNPILDTDGDGVPDDVDVCPASPSGILVDQDGCTELEVCSLDLGQCQSTLSQCLASQCPINLAQCNTDLTQSQADLAQSDADLSQCDADLQQCLATATSDADTDGIPDSLDSCGDTPQSDEVDASGCSHEQFCNLVDASVKGGKKLCKKSDWKNDEPVMSGRDRDCTTDKGGPGREDDTCVPVP